MSTTMPCASSSAARNATRMTKVAPCTFCAGPNTSPRNECATMIWSETSTAYTGHPLFVVGWSVHCRSRRIADQLADHVGGRVENRRQPRRQILEIDRRRDQGVEHGVAEQCQCRLEAPAVAPTGAVRGRDLADLARDEPQPAAVEGFPERHGHVAAAVPAELDHARLLAGEPQRGRKPARAGTGVEDEIAIGRRCVRRREA